MTSARERDAYPAPSSLRRRDPTSPESMKLRQNAERDPPAPKPGSQDTIDALPF